MNDKAKQEADLRLGVKVSFTYKGGRKVKGTVDIVLSKSVWVKLDTDYIGKNVEWFAGEIKLFNKAEMKDIKIQP